jgi:hypothetical protein
LKRSRFDEEQKIGILREVDSGTPVKTVCAKHNIRDNGPAFIAYVVQDWLGRAWNQDDALILSLRGWSGFR